MSAPEWVHGDDVGLPGEGWMSQEEFQGKLNPPTQILPTVDTGPHARVGIAWRVAQSLDVLLGELNALAPRRSKASDGSIGDAAHASRDSDHNPWVGPGIVTARDFTHDPAGGLDCNKLALALVAARDPRIKYVIWNRRIADSRPGNNPWVWMPYSGSNPHTKHLHLSVLPSNCDDTHVWVLPGMTGAPAPSPAPKGAPVVNLERMEQAWAGGVTDDQNNAYDLMMFVKRNNVEIRQSRIALVQLTDLVQTLRSEVAALRQELAGG